MMYLGSLLMLTVSAVSARSALMQQSYNEYAAQASTRLGVTLYYESYCPFCQNFWVEQLAPTYECTSKMIDLRLVPYGNAKHSGNPPYKFTCQHGEQECAGDLFESALLNSQQ